MSEAPSTAPACYRHPSRETSISCTRCEKPICTDCMNEASVGFQCPACVAEGKRSQRPIRTAFGGSRVGRAAYVTRTIIGINLVVMAISAVLGGPRALAGSGGWLQLMGAGTPLTLAGEVLGFAFYGGEVHGIAAGEWWRLGTAMFLHFGLLHLFLNMSLLWQLGQYLEGELGPLRFAGLYLLGGLGGNVAAYVFTPGNQGSAGASTAVFGLVLAMFVINRKLNRDSSTLVPLLVVNVIVTFTVPHVSIAGHLGGLVAGGLAAVALAFAPQKHRGRIQAAGCAALLAVLLIASAVRTQILLG